MDNFFYYGFIFLEKLLFITPKGLKNYLKKILTLLFYNLDKKRKNIVFANLDLAFGNRLSKKEKERIAKEVYKNFINNLFEFIELKNLTKEELVEKIEFENDEKVKEYLKKGPIIFVSAHFGNWEIALLAIGCFLAPISAIARDIDNPKLNKRIKEIREKFNIKIYGKKNSLKYLLKDLQNNKSVAILVDQNASKKTAVDTLFFNKKVLHTPIACVLSKRFNIPIVIGFCEKRDNKWILSFKDIYFCEDIKECVDRQSKIIEEEVKKFPELWYWFHRRFKYYYRNIYENTNNKR